MEEVERKMAILLGMDEKDEIMERAAPWSEGGGDS